MKKKVFISVPMRGRTDEDIKASMEKMHKIAEAVFGEELEAIDSFLEGSEYTGKPLACLGESIKKMQEADYFIGAGSWEYKGCCVEKEAAQLYFDECKIFIIDYIFIFSEEERKKNLEERTGSIPVCAR